MDTVKYLSGDFYRDCVRLDSIENFRQFRPRNTAVLPCPSPAERRHHSSRVSSTSLLPPRSRIPPRLRVREKLGGSVHDYKISVYRSTVKSWTRSKLGGIPSITAPLLPRLSEFPPRGRRVYTKRPRSVTLLIGIHWNSFRSQMHVYAGAVYTRVHINTVHVCACV